MKSPDLSRRTPFFRRRPKLCLALLAALPVLAALAGAALAALRHGAL